MYIVPRILTWEVRVAAESEDITDIQLDLGRKERIQAPESRGEIFRTHRDIPYTGDEYPNKCPVLTHL